MKIIFTLLFIVLFALVSESQWVEQNVPANSGLYSISAVDNNNVWICGADGVVIKTTNGGSVWVLTMSPNNTLDLNNIWGIDGQIAVVAGSSSTHTYIYKSYNSGISWNQVFSQAGGRINSIYGLSLSDADKLIMCGNPVGGRWQLWVSANAGSNWDSSGTNLFGGGYIPQSGSETGFDNSLCIYRGPDLERKIWFGTNNSRIYRWGFLVTNWEYYPTAGLINSRSVLFVNNTTGFAGGYEGMLITTNGGTNWVNWTGVPGNGSINGFAVGYNELYYIRGSTIFQTTDAGISWLNAHSVAGTYYYMQKARESGYNMWAIWNNFGDNSGGISQFTSQIGIKPISSEVPNSYILYQNYPNPFNPSTKIKFSIPPSKGARGMTARLCIYDALGRVIAVLVNEQLQPGTYEVDWNGSNYPSGVYFYKLTTGDFVETRKMILVK